MTKPTKAAAPASLSAPAPAPIKLPRKGGSYVLDPADGTLDRKEFTKPAPTGASAEPGKKEG